MKEPPFPSSTPSKKDELENKSSSKRWRQRSQRKNTNEATPDTVEGESTLDISSELAIVEDKYTFAFDRAQHVNDGINKIFDQRGEDTIFTDSTLATYNQKTYEANDALSSLSNIVSEIRSAPTPERLEAFNEAYAHLDALQTQQEQLVQEYIDQNEGDKRFADATRRIEELTKSTPAAVPEKPKNIREYLDQTHGEKLKSLKEKLKGYEKSETPPYVKPLYEARAEALAAKHNIAAERAAMLEAEKAYFAKLKVKHRDKRTPQTLDKLKSDYEQAALAWRNKLGEIAGSLEGRDKAEALVIQKRDTILRATQLSNEARRQGLDERGKTLLGKVENWSLRLPLRIAKGLNTVSLGAGKGLASVFHKSARGTSLDALAQREALGQRYARAVRIFGGAAIATAVAVGTTPVAATGAALTFAVFSGRSVLSMAAGLGAATATGNIFSKLTGSKEKRVSRRDALRASVSSTRELRALQEQYRKGNWQERAKRKAMLQMGAAVVAGGGTGLLTSPIATEILERLGALEGVQNAGNTVVTAEDIQDAVGVDSTGPTSSESVQANTPHTTEGGASSSVSSTVENAPASHVSPTTPENLLKGAVITKNEGFNSLITELRHSVQTELPPGMQDSSAVMKQLFETPINKLSVDLNAFDPTTGESMLMQPGDQLFLDDNGNLWFQQSGSDSFKLVMENDPTAPNGVRIHPFSEDTPTLGPKSMPQEMSTDAASTTRGEVSVTQSPEAVVTGDPVEGLSRAEAASVQHAVTESQLEGGQHSESGVAEAKGEAVETPSVPPEEKMGTQQPSVPQVQPTQSQDVALSTTAETPTEAPRSEEPSTPVEQPSSESTNLYKNEYGVEIDPSHTRIYAGEQGAYFAYGGSYEQQILDAQKFVLESRTAKVWVDVTPPGTTQPVLAEVFFSAGQDKPQINIYTMENILEQKLPVPNPVGFREVVRDFDV